MGFWPLVIRVIKEADVVLLVIDARMPSLSKNSEIEIIARRFGRKLIYVFNKCDLLSNENLIKLKREYRDSFFVSGIKGKGIDNLRRKLIEIGKNLGFSTTRIGVVGYPNVGKSAIINSLMGARVNAVAPVAGTTKKLKSAKPYFSNLKIIDTPGVIPFDDKESKLGLIAAKNPEKIKNLERLVFRIIELFLEQNEKGLADFYDVLIDSKDPYKIFLDIGKRRGFIMRGGVIDEHRTAMQIVNDWQRGKLIL